MTVTSPPVGLNRASFTRASNDLFGPNAKVIGNGRPATPHSG
jgi:hypothetical protein